MTALLNAHARIRLEGDRTACISRELMREVLYYFYERRLLRQIRCGQMPGHIGIILDGNRRYGQRLGLTDPHAIYSLGARKLDEVLDWCGQLAIPAVTLWVFSTENFERPTEQVSGILAAIEAKMRSLADDPQIHRQRVRVQAIGKLKLLPASTLAAIGAAREATTGYNGMVLTIAVAYGGREEIADAVQALLYEEMRKGATLADAIERITPAAISRHLYMAGSPDPDLITDPGATGCRKSESCGKRSDCRANRTIRDESGARAVPRHLRHGGRAERSKRWRSRRRRGRLGWRANRSNSVAATVASLARRPL